jgi:hypothetical protein
VGRGLIVPSPLFLVCLDRNGEDRHSDPSPPTAHLQLHLKAVYFPTADFSSIFNLRFEDWTTQRAFFERTSDNAKAFRLPLGNFPVRLGIHWHFTWCPTPKKTKQKPSRGNLLSTSNAGLIPFQLARLSLTLLFRLRWLLFESSTSQSTCAAERTSLRLVSSNKTVSWGLWT